MNCSVIKSLRSLKVSAVFLSFGALPCVFDHSFEEGMNKCSTLQLWAANQALSAAEDKLQAAKVLLLASHALYEQERLLQRTSACSRDSRGWSALRCWFLDFGRNFRDPERVIERDFLPE